mgnify:CR=1 FL=1
MPVYRNDAPAGYKEDLEYDSLTQGTRYKNRHYHKLAGPQKMYKNHFDYGLTQMKMPAELGFGFPEDRVLPKRGFTAELNKMPSELRLPAEL